MNKAEYNLFGSKKTVYAPNNEPEAFFTDVIKIKRHGISKNPPEGYVFIWDNRINDEFQRWGKPTELAEECAQAYPLGGGVSSFEIIEWKDGNVLTIIKTESQDSLRFVFGFWAGLNCQEEKAIA